MTVQKAETESVLLFVSEGFFLTPLPHYPGVCKKSPKPPILTTCPGCRYDELVEELLELHDYVSKNPKRSEEGGTNGGK